MTYLVRAETPSVEVYQHLRAAAGLSPKSAPAATAGLAGTWYAVVAYPDNQPVCVLPEHQGCGLGKKIMTALMEHLRRRAPSTAYVSLIADGGARHLYTKYGFAETAPDSVGMALRL